MTDERLVEIQERLTRVKELYDSRDMPEPLEIFNVLQDVTWLLSRVQQLEVGREGWKQNTDRAEAYALKLEAWNARLRGCVDLLLQQGVDAATREAVGRTIATVAEAQLVVELERQ